ncbi:MAG TPA: amidohydrolase family protein [Chloroflexota bacterium]|nr:amidohydrolase family protein [Chloroflexota bacterium]
MTPLPFALLRADRVWDGTGAPPLASGTVLVRRERIVEVGSIGTVTPPEGIPVHEFPGCTILPGLIDTHVHLNGIGDGRPGDDLATLPDELLLLQAAKNARAHLASGVTTLRECGAKGRTTLMLREAMRAGITAGSRLVLCGRPITITGGHLWYFGEETDGVEAARKAVRRLVKEGADFIKIAATGGSTRTSYASRAAFTPEELSAIVDEARRFGKPVATHCAGSAGVKAVLDAGLGEEDTIIHCVFRDVDGTMRFDDDLARRVVDSGAWVDMTLAQAGARERQLNALVEQQGHATEAQQRELSALEAGRRTRSDHFRRLYELGARMVSGSDSAWGHYPIGEFQYEVINHAEYGMGAVPALLTATRDAAACLQLSKDSGTLEPGKRADLLVVEGDPTQNIRDLLRVRAVYQGGSRVILTAKTSEESQT